MGFWIFMLVMGKAFMKSAPKEINYVFGYRTNMSMKNKDTWEFAHKYIGKLWYWLGWILIPAAVIPMLFVIGRSEDTVGTVGGIVCIVELVVLVSAIVPTERAMKKTFDKEGNRKTE